MTEKTIPAAGEAFLKTLKERTAGRHAALEENPLSIALVSPSVTNEQYHLYLRKMYGVMQALETKVFPKVDDIFPLRGREKAGMITNDLSNAEMPEELMPLPEMNVNKALGCIYVTEGSTLGGRFLYKHVQKALGADKDSGAAFFWGYGDQTGTMWKDFIGFLSTYAVENNCEDEISAGADDTFLRINSWMSDK